MRRLMWSSLGLLMLAAVGIAAANDDEMAFALEETTVPVPAAHATPEMWTPLRVFLGSWSGSRTGEGAAKKLKRQYESVSGNQQLLITEKHEGKTAEWGVVAFDPEHKALMLTRTQADGKQSLLALDAAASTGNRVVFEGLESNPGRIRVVYERLTWNAFVERIEYAPAGQEFSLLAEARFDRR